MKKGEESRQLLIECAAELLWKNGYSATGISEILKQTDLPVRKNMIEITHKIIHKKIRLFLCVKQEY